MNASYQYNYWQQIKVAIYLQFTIVLLFTKISIYFILIIKNKFNR